MRRKSSASNVLLGSRPSGYRISGLKRILKWSARVILLALIVAFLVGFIAYWRSTNDCDRKTALVNPMKAIRFCEYGSPDVLKFEDVEKPAPNDDQVLIKVHAASLNFIEPGVTRGPLPLRLMSGLRKPEKTRLGTDVAGQVEAVGKNVTLFKAGDEVFGVARPSLAEHACARERALLIKPANVTFEQAGSVAWAGFTALQGLRQGNIQPGQKVLINGATGGVGTFAVQIAKSFGAEVTGVCSTGNVGAHNWDFKGGSVVAVRPSEVRQVRYETGQRGSEVVERPHANGEGDTRHRPDLQVERARGGDAVFRRRPRARKSSDCRGIIL